MQVRPFCLLWWKFLLLCYASAADHKFAVGYSFLIWYYYTQDLRQNCIDEITDEIRGTVVDTEIVRLGQNCVLTSLHSMVQ